MDKPAKKVKKRGRDLEVAKQIDDPKFKEQGDLFLCDITNWPVKDDLASMEIPLFSLAKRKDLTPRHYQRGNKSINIRPSSDGAATVFDKDLLLYISSQIIAALNDGREISKTVKISTTDFLTTTCRADGGNQYAMIMDMLRRLRGTTIETNIETGGITQTKGFGLIDNFEVISSKKSKKRKPEEGEISEIELVYEFSVTISDWLYNGLVNFEALTIDRTYFELKKPIERRLYEIGRKHCGNQAYWKINIDLLAEKIGISGARFRVREDIKKVIKNNPIPDFNIALDTTVSPDMVVFLTKDSRKLSLALQKEHDGLQWYQSLLKK